MISRTFRNKVKTSSSPLFRALRWCYHATQRPPVPRGIVFRALYKFLFGLGEAIVQSFQFLRTALWSGPVLCARCEHFGKDIAVDALPYIVGSGHITLGDRVRLSGKSSFAFNTALDTVPKISIGSDTFVGHGSAIAAGKSVHVGSHCYIAGGCRISDNDGHRLDARERRENVQLGPENHAAVVLGDEVWLGAGVRVLKGVTIGDRSIIGAGSIVTRSIPADSIAAGNPARVIRSLARNRSTTPITDQS